MAEVRAQEPSDGRTTADGTRQRVPAVRQADQVPRIRKIWVDRGASAAAMPSRAPVVAGEDLSEVVVATPSRVPEAAAGEDLSEVAEVPVVVAGDDKTMLMFRSFQV